LQSGDIDRALTSRKIQYRGLKLGPDNAATRFSMEGIKGELFLDSLRRKVGDDRFLALMRDFFKANAGKAVTAQAFLNAAGTPFEFTEPEDGAAYTVGDIRSRLATAIIVYGTVREAGANRYAAEQLQNRYLDSFENSASIYKDFEATDELLNHRDVIFVGRPETNSALAEWSGKLGLEYSGASFKIDGATHASEREALLLAAKNPLDAKSTDSGRTVYGGDGTLMEAISGLIGSEIPLVILPGGSANVVATELGIPKDLQESCTLLVHGPLETKTIDVGQFDTRYFITGVSLGFATP